MTNSQIKFFTHYKNDEYKFKYKYEYKLLNINYRLYRSHLHFTSS